MKTGNTYQPGVAHPSGSGRDDSVPPPQGVSLSLCDLSDARRDKKPWLVQDDRDVTNGFVGLDSLGKPSCLLHGSMNRVHPTERIYRCSDFRCGMGAMLK